MSASLDQLRQRAVPVAATIGQATVVEQSRAVAEVAAAVQVAQQFPRDMDRVRAEVIAACSTLSLARKAFYAVANRGEGKSVHLARELARIYGNFQSGVHELRRDDEAGVSEVQAFAWEVQSNNRSTRTFISPHQRMKGGKRVPLVDLNDVYLSNQNTGARAVRECIFAALPTWLVDLAEETCRQTLTNGEGKATPERARDAVTAFARFNVAQGQLEARIGRPMAQWDGADIASLEVVFSSLRNGETTVDEQFEPVRVKAADVAPAARQEAPAAAPTPQPDPEPKSVPAPAQTGEPLADRRQVQRLQILLRGALENDREVRLAWVEEQIGRPIESTNELTVLEADRCIKAAEALPTRGKPATAEEPPEDPWQA